MKRVTTTSGPRHRPPCTPRYAALLALLALLIGPAQAADLAPPELALSRVEFVQDGTGHYAALEQTDDTYRNQIVSLQQSGEPQRATVTQSGSDNLVSARQQGAASVLDIVQNGRFNQVDIRQSGNNSATLRQIGNSNSANIAQAAGSAPLWLEQIGNGKVYSLIQY